MIIHAAMSLRAAMSLQTSVSFRATVTRPSIASRCGRVLSLALLALACRSAESDPARVPTPSEAVAPAAERSAAGTPAAVTPAASPGSAGAAAVTPAAAAAPVPAKSPEECGQLERKAQHAVTTAYFVMDSGGVYLSAFDEAWQGLEGCPASEPLWYTFSHMAELGFHRLPMQVAGVHVADVEEATALAFARQPRSARIAVVDARTHGGVERARHALALDPSYAPARVALAQALFDEQLEIDEAFPLSDAPSVPGAASLRARLLVARGKPGDAKLAERLARKELTASWDAPEAYDMQPVRCAAQEALGIALHAQHARSAKTELGKAVQCGSTRANMLLQRMP